VSDDHSKVKDPLPQRPRGGHPQMVLPPLPRDPRSRRRILAVRGWLVAAAAAVAMVALSACDPFPEGPAGTVTGKHSEYHSSTKTRWYFLTTTGTFRVDHSDYDSCKRGSSYPDCAN